MQKNRGVYYIISFKIALTLRQIFPEPVSAKMATLLELTSVFYQKKKVATSKFRVKINNRLLIRYSVLK